MISKNKFRMLRYFFAFLMTFAMSNCSKDDSNEPSVNGGGKVYRYQSVTIEVSNMELSQNQYTATFGSLNVLVLKADSSTLTFMIPADAALGSTKLSIPDLNNTKLSYEVLQPTLAQTPQETVAPLLGKFETFFTGISTPTTESGIANNNYLQFKNYWNNNATDAEKEQIALWYQTNKTLIDEIFYLGDNIGGRTVNTTNGFGFDIDFQAYKHVVGKVVAVAGIVVIATGAAPVLAGVALIGVGIKICNDANVKLIDFKKGLNLEADGLSGYIDRMQNNSIQLISDELHTTSFRIQSGTISQEDANSSNDLLKGYFSTTSILNNTINQVDNTIDWVNSQKSTSCQPFDEVVIPATSTESTNEVTPEIMPGIKFSINHPNLKLVSATLASNGQLNLKVKVIGEPTINPVVSTLNYTYSDEISEFSGYFDITVGDPDKVIRYNITLNGVNYTGVKNLYLDGMYGDGESWFYYGSDQSTYSMSFVFGANQRIYFSYVPLSLSGNFTGGPDYSTSMWLRDDVNEYSCENDYLNPIIISKSGSTGFTFNGGYLSGGYQGQSKINASGSVIVE